MIARIVVDPDSGLAPWRQVYDQLVHLIRTGALPVGARLPTIRQLSRDLGLSPGTVARAYRELESRSVLRTARRNGTVVAAVPDVEPCHATTLTAAAAEYVERAIAAGADVHAAVAAVLATFAAHGAEGDTAG